MKDPEAIRAVQIDDGMGIGIDVTNWEAIKEQPFMQAIAAILDAGIIIGSKEAIDKMSKQGQPSINMNLNNSNNDQININNY